MTYKKPTPEYIQSIADCVAWRKEELKKGEEFKAKLRERLLKVRERWLIEDVNDKV